MSESLPDHYAVLGLDRRCTADEIRAAYRLVMRKLHPDVNASPCARPAQEVNAAHETLSDPQKRRAYDRKLAGRKETPSPAGEKIRRDLKQDVHLRVEDFLRGTHLGVKVNDPANTLGLETYPLEIPPDTVPGERFRLPRAAPFEGGFVIIRVKAAPGFRFKVRGSDLRCDLRISIQRATQGGTEMTPGALGRLVRVIIPPRVARGAIIRVPGEGLPKSRGGRGDLLVRITYRPEVRVTRR